MFDFGFWELAIVMVVALLVVGPERLPALAGQIGRWVGKAKRMIESVRSDIESEIKAAELKEILEKQQNEIGELKEMLKDTKNEIEKDFNEIEKDFEEDGDSELIRAVEEHIEANKNKSSQIESSSDKSRSQQELSLSAEIENESNK
ncbi:MAG: Sec-independent protein translocase protein TatB [Pseudomonadota bacterium]